MTTISNPPARVIGCAVGKASITVFNSVRRTDQRRPQAKARPRANGPGVDAGCLIVCEATGGYEAKLLAAMLAAGVPAHRADARKVKAFVRSFGTLGNPTRSMRRRWPAMAPSGMQRWPAGCGRTRCVRSCRPALLARVDLVRLRQAQMNRLAAPGADVIETALRGIVREANKQLRAIEARIAAWLRGHPALARDIAVLRGMRGIGDVTAAALLALTPELGALSGREAASPAGVARHPHGSGSGSDIARPGAAGRM